MKSTLPETRSCPPVSAHLASSSSLTSDSEEPKIRIVLVGKTGSGKSAAGNTILGRKAFQTTICPTTLMRESEKETGEFEGVKLSVVDTPGLFHTSKTHQQVKTDIAKSISLSAPGPHVFLVVLRPDRFTQEEQKTVKIIQELFGYVAGRYTMVLFTHGDDLQEEGVCINTFIGQSPALSHFISQCSGGFHVFNNREQDPAQVRDLLDKIHGIVERNGGRCYYYTNEMLQEAEKATTKEMKRVLKKFPNMTLEEARRRAEDSYRRNIRLNSATGAAIAGCIMGPMGALLGAGVGVAAVKVKKLL